MNSHLSRRALTACTVPFIAASMASRVQADQPTVGLGGIVFHYVGRVQLNPDSTGIVYGYITTLSGVAELSSLFNGAPSEASAYLTFRADINVTPLPGNGPLGPGQFGVTPFLVKPGSWSIYFTPAPAHSWFDPNTFSNGQIVATLERPWEQFSIYPTFSINAGAATLVSSIPFKLTGRTINFRDLAPLGLVDVTSGSPIPVGGAPNAPVFAVSGYSLVAAR